MRANVLILVVLVIVCIGGSAAADMEAVRTSYGSLIIGGVFQPGFSYYLGEEQVDFTTVDVANGESLQVTDRRANADFYLNHARINFKGTIIDDKVRFFAKLDLSPDQAGNMPVQLLEAKIGLKYIPYTTLWMGRFAPDFTYFNPINVARMGLIDFPLMNQHLGIQRQSGVNANVLHKWFEFTLGATNGLHFDNFATRLNPPDRNRAGVGNVDWSDENTMKDFFVSAAVKPVYGMRIWAGYWYGRPIDFFEPQNDGENKPHMVKADLFNAGFAYMAQFGLTIMGEGMYVNFKYDNQDANNNQRDEDFLQLTMVSYYARLGFNMKELVGVPVEILAQYDWIDPDRINDNDTHGMDDERTYITAGLNYYIKDHHAMLSVNYLYKNELWKVIPLDGEGTQTGLKDDELKFQAQVAF